MPSPIIGKARGRSPSRPPLRPPALRRRRCPPPRLAGAGDQSPSEGTTVLSVVAWLHHEWLDDPRFGYIEKWLDRELQQADCVGRSCFAHVGKTVCGGGV